MRGNPRWRILIALLSFIFVGLPVWWVTSAPIRPAMPAVPSSASTLPAATVPLLITINYEETPRFFSIGESSAPPLAQAQSPVIPQEFRVEIPHHYNGSDFILDVKWPGPVKRHAFQIQLHAADYPPIDQTFWSNGDLHDVVTLGHAFDQ